MNAKAKEWNEQGDKAGDMFAMQVALDLARGNFDRVKDKKPLAAFALRTLGWCHIRLGERSSGDQHLHSAMRAFGAAVEKTSKAKEPEKWSAAQRGRALALENVGRRRSDATLLAEAVSAQRQALKVDQQTKSANLEYGWNGLGIALQSLGELTQDEGQLREAEEALTTALGLNNKEKDAISWAITQSNLALSQRGLGAVTGDSAKLQAARDGYAACEALDYQADAPFIWATLQWNIADLALARYRLAPDPAFLVEAREYVGRARAFFIDGSEYQTGRCDELIAQIDAAPGVTPR